MKPEIFLILNPGSRNGRSRQVAEKYKNLLTARGQRYDSSETETLGDAVTLTRQAISAGYKIIAAVGGDGTINGVLNGFMTSPANPDPVRLAVLYSGTSPDFCRFHGLPTTPPEAVDILMSGLSHPIDLCRLITRSSDQAAAVSYFGCSSNIGLGAPIAARANRLRRYWGDTVGTLMATIVTIATCSPRRYRMRLDNEVMELPSTLNITIGKNNFLAGGLKLAVDITPADGSMFVFALTGISRFGLLTALSRVYSGSITGDPRFLLRRARKVSLESLGDNVQTEIDGDPAAWCPVEIEVVPRVVELIGGRQ